MITYDLLPTELSLWPHLTMFLCFYSFYNTNNKKRVLQSFNPLLRSTIQLNLCGDLLKLWHANLNPSQLLMTAALYQEAVSSHLRTNAGGHNFYCHYSFFLLSASLMRFCHIHRPCRYHILSLLLSRSQSVSLPLGCF